MGPIRAFRSALVFARGADPARAAEPLILRPTRWAVWFVAVALACTGDPSDATGRGAGAATLDVSAVPRGVLTEDLRLDANREDFSVVRRVLVGAAGQIVVRLTQDRELRIYDSTGVEVGRAGRQGEGPGEFQSLSELRWSADSLWVYDHQARRITHLSADGAFLRTTPVRTPFPLTVPGETQREGVIFFPSVLYPDGSMFGYAYYMVPERNRMSDGVHVLRATDGSGTVLVRGPSLNDDPRWIIDVEGFGALLPFAMAPYETSSADGSLIAGVVGNVTSDAGGVVTLSLVRATGDTVLARDYPFEGVPVSAAERDSAIAALKPPGNEPPREGPADLYDRRQAIARERIPPVHAPVTGLLIGLDGTIWIQLRETAEGRPTLVLDQRGDPIGSVLLPSNSTIRQATRTRIWVTEVDPFDLVSVVRYRVDALPSAAPNSP